MLNKKILASLLAVVTIISLALVNIQTDNKNSGFLNAMAMTRSGQSLTLSISDFSYRIENDNICITGYNGTSTEVVIAETYEVDGIEKTVNSIDESAFESNEEITSISLPATIEYIGDYAFYDCTSLTDVTLFSRDATIGELAFGYYYISRKQDGKVEGFILHAYEGSTAEEYTTEHELSFLKLTGLVKKGDVDGDGEINSKDLVALIKHLLGVTVINSNELEASDLNSDNTINIIDLIRLKKVLVAQANDNPTINQYTVTFIDWDGAVLKTQIVNEGEDATAPANPTRSGFIFNGWDKTFNNITANIVVTAMYVASTDPAIEVANKTVSSGATDVKVAVSLKNNPGFLTMALKITFDSNILTLNKVTNGSNYTYYNFTSPKNKTSGCTAAWFASDLPGEILDGDIMILQFSVADNAPSGQYSVTISCPNDGSTVDENKQEIFLTDSVGYINVENNEIISGEPKIIANTVIATAGATNVEIAVYLKNNPGFLTMALKTEFNSEYLTLTKVTNGTNFASYNFTSPKNKNSGCTAAWFASDLPDNILDGDILVLKFSVANNTPIGQYPITVSCPNDGSTLDGNKQAFTLQNAVGYITVN